MPFVLLPEAEGAPWLASSAPARPCLGGTTWTGPSEGVVYLTPVEVVPVTCSLSSRARLIDRPDSVVGLAELLWHEGDEKEREKKEEKKKGNLYFRASIVTCSSPPTEYVNVDVLAQGLQRSSSCTKRDARLVARTAFLDFT